MVIRRIREHVAAHNWFAVSVDVAIVVVGVFLGTQANNWNQDRIDRAGAAEYRQQIIEDLKSNEADIDARKAYYGAVRAHAIAALASIESLSRPPGEPFLIDAYQASQVWLRPLVRTGYDEMTGADFSHGIGDKETRSRLTAYYTQIRQFDITALGTTPYRERLRQAFPYKIHYAVQRQCGDRVTTLAGGAQVAALPDRCTLSLDAPTIAAAVSRLHAANLDEDLTRHIADIDQKMAAFDRFQRLARDIRRQLELLDRG